MHSNLRFLKVKLVENFNLGFLFWVLQVLLLVSCLTLPSFAQNPTPPSLGSAANFGLLSGGNISSDKPVYVQGSAGASGSISNEVAAANNARYTYLTTPVPAALTNLSSAITYCTGLTGQTVSASLAGQSLAGGVYKTASATTLAGTLTLTGDSNSVYVFVVSGGLSFTGSSGMNIGHVKPANIYWSVTGGNISITDATYIPGVFLCSGSITKTGLHSGYAAFLAQGNISLSGLSATIGHNQFFSSLQLQAMPAMRLIDAPVPVSCVDGESMLIRNGNFEERPDNTCPFPIHSIEFTTTSVSHWFRPDPFTTPDYYNSCGNGTIYNGIPDNYSGSQPSRSGNGYAHIIADGQFYIYGEDRVNREYITQDLQDPLEPGFYFTEFYISKTTTSARAVNGIGMLISNTRPSRATLPVANEGQWGLFPGSPLPQVELYNANGLNDTINWVRVAGCFEANGDERFITIGNFRDNSHTTEDAAMLAVIETDTNGIFTEQFHIASYYIEDVALSRIPTAGPNVVRCLSDSVQIGECAVAAVSGATYSWEPSTGLTDATIPMPYAFPDVTTTYTLTVIIPGCDTVVSQATVTVLPPAVTVANHFTCAGAPVTLQATVTGTPQSFSWMPATGLSCTTCPNPVATLTSSGLYSVVVTSEAGCIDTATFNIIIGSPPVPIVTSGAANCGIPGLEVMPTFGTGPYTYQWSPNPNSQTGPQLTHIPNGTYTVTVTDANNCTGTASASVVSGYDFINPVITTNTTWGGGYPNGIRVLGTVRVDSGATLMIMGSTPGVYFAYDSLLVNNINYPVARILVMPGGQLYCNGANLMGCNGGTWDGIEVWGNPNEPQDATVQGKVYVGDGSIRNATIGIRAERRRFGNEVFPEPHEYTGGMLETTGGAHIINNRQGIVLRNYETEESASRIWICDFLFDETSPFAAESEQMEFIRLENIQGVRLQSNEYTSDLDFAPDARGTAIYSLNAGYFVEHTHYTQYGRNTFNNLTRGIDAANINPLTPVRVQEHEFLNVQRGIYIQGGSFDEIDGNYFTVPAPANTDSTFGIFMAGATDFTIENNQFEVANSSNGPTYGIIIHNSQGGGGNPVIFNNSFSGGSVQLQVQGQNNTLKIKCNTFASPEQHGLAVVNHPNPTPITPVTTLAQQGAGCVDHTEPAGNEWQPVCSNNSNRDIMVGAGINFTYFAHFGLGSSTGPQYTQPFCRNLQTVTVCGVYKNSGTCGNNALFVLPPAPPVTPLVDYENQVYGAISTYDGDIDQLWDEYLTTNNTNILDQIVVIEQEQRRLKTELVRQYLYLGEEDKLRDALEADSAIEARILLAGIYFQDHELLDVRQQLLAIADQDPAGEFYNTEEFVDLMNVLVGLAENNTELSQADKQQLNVLFNLAEMGFTKAEVVLEPIEDQRQYQGIYPLVSDNPAARYRPAPKVLPRSKPKAKAAVATATLTAYPNPTAGNYTVNYYFPLGSEEATLHVYNMQGKLVEQHVLKGDNGNLELHAAGLPAGLYLLQANCKGRKVASYKLTVQ